MTGRIRAVLLVAVGVVCTAAQAPPPTRVSVDMIDAHGERIGTATITYSTIGVAIALDLAGLPPGDHGIHFHQRPKCDGPDFSTAGPHVNPSARKHGLDNPDGPHAGDMRNLTVAADGTAKMTLEDDRMTLGPGPASVFAGGGTSLVIHADPDDMRTDPSGNSGARIACGIITRP